MKKKILTLALILFGAAPLFSQSIGSVLLDGLAGGSTQSTNPVAQLVTTNFCKQAGNNYEKFTATFEVVRATKDTIRVRHYRTNDYYTSTYTQLNKKFPLLIDPMFGHGNNPNVFGRDMAHFIYFIDSVNYIVVIDNVKVEEPNESGKNADGIYINNGVETDHRRVKSLEFRDCPDSLIWAHYTLDKDRKKVKKMITAKANPDQLDKALAMVRQYLREEEQALLNKYAQEKKEILKDIRSIFAKKFFKPENLLLRDAKGEAVLRDWWKEAEFYNTRYTLTKIVWIDKNYDVIKDKYNFPSERVKDAVMVLQEKSTKKCFAILQRIGQEYEGGGVYSAAPELYNTTIYYTYAVNISIGEDYVYEIDCLK